MQTCVDFGANYDRFDIHDAVAGRKTVSREVATAANAVRCSPAERLNDRINTDGTLASCIAGPEEVDNDWSGRTSGFYGIYFQKEGQKDYRVSSGVLLKIEVGIR